MTEEYPEDGEYEEDGENSGPILDKKPVFASADFAPDGKTLLTAGWDGVLADWDTGSGRLLRTLLEPGPTPDADASARTGDEGEPDGTSIRVIRLSEYQRGWSLPTVRFSMDGTVFAVGSLNGFVVVWNAHSRGEIFCFKPHLGGVSALDFSGDGRRLATGSREWGGVTLRLWRMPGRPEEGFREIFSNETHAGGVRNIRFSPNGRFLAASGVPLSSYTAPLVLKTRSGRQKSQLNWDTSWAVEFSPRGQLLATGNDFGAVRIWDWKRGKQVLKIRAHRHMVWTLAWAPDGRSLASGSEDGAVRIWNIRDGRLIREFAVDGKVLTCRFFEEGRVLLAAAATEAADKPDIRGWTI